MSGFFDRMMGRGKKNDTSASTARERLRLVLVHDRMNLPPEKLQAMKEEILAVIARYIPVEGQEIDISLAPRDDNSNKLVAEVPFPKHAYASSAADDSEDDDEEPEDNETLIVITTEDDPAYAASLHDDSSVDVSEDETLPHVPDESGVQSEDDVVSPESQDSSQDSKDIQDH